MDWGALLGRHVINMLGGFRARALVTGLDGDAHRRADWSGEPRGPAERPRGDFDSREAASYNISGIWCNLSPALIRFVSAQGRPALDFHSFPRFLWSLLRSRLKGSSFPCGSIRRIIVLLETTQLFNYQDLSPRSLLTPPPPPPTFFFSFLFFFSPRIDCKEDAYQCSPWHDTTRQKNKDWRGEISLEVLISEGPFHNNLSPNQIAPYSL